MADRSDILENPFSARRIRPGALPFFFPARHSVDRLIDRLRGSGWRGEIVGPHGSGKSTLLETLCPAIEAAGRPIRRIELHDGAKVAGTLRVPSADAEGETRRGGDKETGAVGGVLIIDGYEQLGRWQRWRTQRYCRRHGWGLLVTTHQSLGLPGLFHAGPTLALAQRIVAELQQGYPAQITPEDVAKSFWRHRTNLREMLFDLYDVYQQRMRG